MKHLALILSPHVRRLELLDKAAHGVGLKANCCDNVAGAMELLRRYADDYHVVLVDEECFDCNASHFPVDAATAHGAEEFLAKLLAISQTCRLMYLVSDNSDFKYSHGRVSVRRMSDIHCHLPRLKGVVTRERTRRIKLESVSERRSTSPSEAQT